MENGVANCDLSHVPNSVNFDSGITREGRGAIASPKMPQNTF